MKRLILLCTLSLLAVGGLFAQNGRSLQNSWLHLDKPFYVTEDALGFQLYLAPEFAAQSIVVQSILFDATGEAKWYAYWSNDKGSTVAGKLIVPQDLPTGWYYLSFRVWDYVRQTERVLLSAPVAVYNDQAPILPEQVSGQEPSRQTAPVEIPEKELTVAIEGLTQNISPTEKMTIELKVTDRRGRAVAAQVSVSVTDWGLMGASLAMGMDNLQQGDSLRVVTPGNIFPATFWQGVHLTQEGNPVGGKTLLGNLAEQKEVITPNARGTFVWQHPQMARRAPYGFEQENGEPAVVKFRPAPGRLALGQLFYTPAAFRYLEVNRQRKLLKAMYDSVGKDNADDYQNQVVPFSGPYRLVGVDPQRQLHWQYTPSPTALPGNTTIYWSTGEVTSQAGAYLMSYDHPPEATTYRLDVVAQDAEGRRGRKIAYYRVP